VKMNQLKAEELEKFFSGGYAFLAINKEMVNALNVFPVPDGDTGINMALTMASAVKDLQGKKTVASVAQSVSNGALMGARGNSGVILSQIFRGFAQGVGDKQVLNARDFAFAMQRGVDLAYRAVMRPVEGTILTVFKQMAAAATFRAAAGADTMELLEYVLEQGQVALDNTPKQLPVLKQAGVVDAGGKGLLVIFEGGFRALMGEEFHYVEGEKAGEDVIGGIQTEGLSTADITFSYCTEMIVKGENIPVESVRDFLADKGDSQVAVGTPQMVKIHVHTNDPGAIMSHMIQYGTLHSIKVDNMREQYEAQMAASKKNGYAYSEAMAGGNCAVVTVGCGEGIKNLFLELGAAYIINGGQSMNPSAEDILNAINKVPAKEVVVLPNNSNIILTAEQAKKLAEKTVSIVPTKFITQGMAAMLGFDMEDTAENNAKRMQENIQNVKSGEVTFAVRDSSYDGKEIMEGDILGLADGKLVEVGKDVSQVVLNLLGQMVGEDDSIITLLYGDNITKEDAEALFAKVEEAFPNLEIELQMGGQNLYYFLLAVE